MIVNVRMSENIMLSQYTALAELKFLCYWKLLAAHTSTLSVEYIKDNNCQSL